MDCVRMMNSANDQLDETVRMNIEPRFCRKHLMPLRASRQEDWEWMRIGGRVIMTPLPEDCHFTVTRGCDQKWNLLKPAAPSVRRGMFIECGYERCGPPSGGSCL